MMLCDLPGNGNRLLEINRNIFQLISFEAEFSWDPGIVYKFVGHKRTGFLEDENPHY